MNLNLSSLSIALPEMVLLIMSGLCLLTEAFTTPRWKGLTYGLVQLSLVMAFCITLVQYQHLAAVETTFSGHYVLDRLAVLVKLFVYGLSFASFLYAREYIAQRGIARGEYYLLGLFSVMGMSVMASAYSLLTIYLGLELLSLPLYALVASYKDSVQASEAAMKYFVMGALASGMLLYGISIIYGLTGTIDLPALTQHMPVSPSSTALLGMIFIVAALAFKFGAVPFHMWVPDVYHGAPTSVTLFIATAPKIAAFGVTLRILVQALPELHVAWEQILIVISLLSMFMGNLIAIVQTNVKRMLAYSSIAHIGYTLLGLIAGPSSTTGYSAALFYIVTYTLVAAGAFGILTMLSRQGYEFEELADFKGLSTRSPWLAFIMMILMFSMAGVPPTVGFFAKFTLISSLVQANLLWLAVAGLMFALIGAYYYLRVVMLMYFEEPTPELKAQPILCSWDLMTAATLNGGAALALGILPEALMTLCKI